MGENISGMKYGGKSPHLPFGINASIMRAHPNLETSQVVLWDRAVERQLDKERRALIKAGVFLLSYGEHKSYVHYMFFKDDILNWFDYHRADTYGTKRTTGGEIHL